MMDRTSNFTVRICRTTENHFVHATTTLDQAMRKTTSNSARALQRMKTNYITKDITILYRMKTKQSSNEAGIVARMR